MNGPESKLYVSPATAVMVTDPVAKVQVGCVAVNVGAAGVAGCALSVILETEEIQPAAFWAVTVCEEPAASPL